jgi:hypothetical protein
MCCKTPHTVTKKTGNVHLNINEARSRGHSCHGKSISIIYSECVFVALVMQHVKRMRSITLSIVARPATPYFSTLSHKRLVKVKLSRYRPGGVPGGLGSRISRQWAHKGGKAVSTTHRPSLPAGRIPGTHFC